MGPFPTPDLRALGRRLIASSCLATLLAVAACGGGGGGGGTPAPPPIAPPAPVAPDQPALRFTEQSAAVGLTRPWGYAHSPTSDPEYMASGLAAVDYDADGDIDVYVAGGNVTPNRLFENQGDGTFVDVAADVGLDLVHKGSGPTFADIDGDGDLDLFIGAVEGDPYYLMENRDGTFVDVTAASGLAMFATNTFSAAFADYDEDGDLDMALAHWGNAERDDTETLWRNNGDWTFESYSRQSRIAETLIDSSDPEELQIRAPAFRRDNSFTPNFADIDSDGDLDLLMASDFRTSQVFSNDGDGRFTLATDREVIKDQAGMGAAVVDYDNDGDLDWFVTSIYRTRAGTDELIGYGNRLYANDGTGTFADVTDDAGVANGGWGWAACFADFDNDGHPDIFHVNGWREENDEEDNDYANDRVRLFRANGEGAFVDEAEASGLTDRGQGRGVACFDADRDGDIDILITNNDDNPLRYYRNDTALSASYLGVSLDGFGVGARVTVTAAGISQVQEMRAGNNYVSQNPLELHFGLGQADARGRDRQMAGRVGDDNDRRGVQPSRHHLPHGGTGGAATDRGFGRRQRILRTRRRGRRDGGCGRGGLFLLSLEQPYRHVRRPLRARDHVHHARRQRRGHGQLHPRGRPGPGPSRSRAVGTRCCCRPSATTSRGRRCMHATCFTLPPRRTTPGRPTPRPSPDGCLVGTGSGRNARSMRCRPPRTSRTPGTRQ